MLPTTFLNSNFVFQKPKSMTDEDCFDLPVYKGVDQAGTPVIVSCWRFSKEDLEEIQKTGCMYLQIVGNGMPPVTLFTEDPFK